MSDFDTIDFSTDESLVNDPYPYFEHLHRPAGSRRYQYEPTFILRGLTALHIDFTPLGDGR